MTTNTNTVDVDEKTFCAVHPDVETGLRCNRCGRYMCTRCAVRTPVGYRCKQCVNQQQDAFYKATQQDYLVGTGVALALAVPIGFVAVRLPLLLILFLGVPAGILIGEAVFRACGRRKARYLPHIAVGCIILGVVVGLLPVIGPLLRVMGDADVLVYLGYQLLPAILYIALSGFAAFGRLR
jgi:hypothetical protein